MSIRKKSGLYRAFCKWMTAVLCVLCLQPLNACSDNTGNLSDDDIINHAIRYSYARIELDMAYSSILYELPDAKIEVSFIDLKESQDGTKEIKLEPNVTSDTMAAWSPDEWAQNYDDLFFNVAIHFAAICKQSHEIGEMPDNYELTCEKHMIVYNSQKTAAFIITPDGVFRKTDNPNNPIGEAIYLTEDA